MRIHDFSHISHILTSTERFMKKLLILLLGLLLLQISYSRSVLIPKNRPELVISKIYNPSSGKILVIYQCKDWLNRVTNSFAAPEFMIRIGSTIMSLSAADYDWPVSTDGSEWVKVTDLNDMPLTAGTKSPYVQQIRITADVNPQTELRPATVTFFSTDQTQTATVSVTQEAAGPAFRLDDGRGRLLALYAARKAARSRHGRGVRRHDGRRNQFAQILHRGVSRQRCLEEHRRGPAHRTRGPLAPLFLQVLGHGHRRQLSARQYHANHPFHRSRRGCGASATAPWDVTPAREARRTSRRACCRPMGSQAPMSRTSARRSRATRKRCSASATRSLITATRRGCSKKSPGTKARSQY